MPNEEIGTAAVDGRTWRRRGRWRRFLAPLVDSFRDRTLKDEAKLGGTFVPLGEVVGRGGARTRTGQRPCRWRFGLHRAREERRLAYIGEA